MKSPPIAWFLPLPEHGHILPTLKLARRLRAEGWEIVYITHPKFASLLSRHGFQIVEQLTPSGGDGGDGSADRAQRRKMGKSRDYLATHRAAREQVRTLKPSAVFLDVFRSGYCYAPVAEGVPTIVYHTCRDAESRDTPPLIRGYGSPSGPISKARLWMDWQWLWRLRLLRWEAGAGRAVRARRRAARVVFRQCGLSIRPSSMSVSGLDVNTAVMGPAALSMGNLSADRYFGYGLVDDVGGIGHDAAEFPVFANKLPVVYCTFGSMSARYGDVYPIYNDIIDVFAAQGKFNLIAQAGEVADRLSDRGAANVRVEGFVPQLAYLARSSVAITHGGYGTVKECVAREVPMLAIPFFQDQFGTARMLGDLGVGATLSCRRFDARKAHRLVEGLAADPRAKARLRALYSSEQDEMEFERAYASLLARIRPTLGVPVPPEEARG